MDTRSKILDWPSALELLARRGADATSGKVVVGYFDPLLASHARRLDEIAGTGKLFVVVTSPARPLIEAAARAELVAALETVEHVVVVPPAKLQDLLRLIPAERIVPEQAADSRRTEELVRHVHARQKA